MLFTFLEDVFLEVVVAEDFNVFVEAEDEASDAEVTDDFCLEEPVVWAVGCLSLLYRVTASTSIATRPSKQVYGSRCPIGSEIKRKTSFQKILSG